MQSRSVNRDPNDQGLPILLLFLFWISVDLLAPVSGLWHSEMLRGRARTEQQRVILSF